MSSIEEDDIMDENFRNEMGKIITEHHIEMINSGIDPDRITTIIDLDILLEMMALKWDIHRKKEEEWGKEWFIEFRRLLMGISECLYKNDPNISLSEISERLRGKDLIPRLDELKKYWSESNDNRVFQLLSGALALYEKRGK